MLTFPIKDYGISKYTDIPVVDISNDYVDVLLEEGNVAGDKDLVEMTQHFQFAFENSGYMIDGKVITVSVEPQVEKPTLLQEIAISNADDKYNISDEKMEKWTYLKGAKRIKRTARNGHQYIFSEGAIAFPDPIDRPARTMLTSESSLNRSTHVIQDPGNGRLRLLTPVEAERIQGFDEDWTNTGMPESFRYFCMGNALVVPMITRMGETLNRIIENEQ